MTSVRASNNATAEYSKRIKRKTRKYEKSDSLLCMLCGVGGGEKTVLYVTCRNYRRHCQVAHKDFISYRMQMDGISESDAVMATFEDHVLLEVRDMTRIQDWIGQMERDYLQTVNSSCNNEIQELCSDTFDQSVMIMEIEIPISHVTLPHSTENDGDRYNEDDATKGSHLNNMSHPSSDKKPKKVRSSYACAKSSTRKYHSFDQIPCLLCDTNANGVKQVMIANWKRHCQRCHKDFISYRMRMDGISEADVLSATLEDHVSNLPRDMSRIQEFNPMAAFGFSKNDTALKLEPLEEMMDHGSLVKVQQQLPPISSLQNSSKTTAEYQSVIVDSTVKRQQRSFALAVSKVSSSMSKTSIRAAESFSPTVSKSNTVRAPQTAARQAFFEDVYTNLLRYRKVGFLCDVMLISGRKSLLAHSVVIAGTSPVLKAALEESSSEAGLRQIDLHEYDLFTLEVAVHFMYTGVLLLPADYRNDLRDYQHGGTEEGRISTLINNLQKMGLNKDTINTCEIKFKRSPKAICGRIDTISKTSVSPVKSVQIEITQVHSLATDASCRVLPSCINNGVSRICDVVDASVLSPIHSDPLLLNTLDNLASNINETDHFVFEREENIAKEIAVCHSYALSSYNENPSSSDVCVPTVSSNVENENSENENVYVMLNPEWESVLTEEVVVNKQIDSEEQLNIDKSVMTGINDDDNRSAQDIHNASASGNNDMDRDISLESENDIDCNTTKFNKEIVNDKISKKGIINKNHRSSKKVRNVSQCTICVHTFPRPGLLSRHMDEQHFKKRPFLCDSCGMGFAQKSTLLSHTLSKHGFLKKESWTCSICLLVFKNNAEYRKHCLCVHDVRIQSKFQGRGRSHAHALEEGGGEEAIIRHLCDICGKELQSKGSLATHKKRHTIMHTDKLRFTCGICKRTYYSDSYLKYHVLTQHSRFGRPTFPCSTCNKEFSSEAVRLAHTTVHTGNLPFECNICGKAFSYRVSLASHVKLHSDEKPFKCNNCDRAYRLHGHLKRHMEIHSGVKRYQCQLCSKSFRISSLLRKHCIQDHGAHVSKETVNTRASYSIEMLAEPDIRY